MRVWAWLLVLGLALTLWPAAAVAQAPKRVALVIANAAYAHASRLTNPGNDAKVVSAALRQAGFQTVDVKADLGIAAMRTALRDFRAKAAGAEVALVYYAGHGIEANGRNWLLPTDSMLASELDLVDEAIDLDRVMQDLSGADLRVLILDACRDNPFGRSWRKGTRAFTRGLGGIDADDVLVIYAAAPGQTASDGSGKNSPFAEALAKRLPEAGLPIQLLGNVVRDDVLKSTGNVQKPFVSASITGTPYYLVPGAATPPAPDPNLAAMRKRAEDAERKVAESEAQLATLRERPAPSPAVAPPSAPAAGAQRDWPAPAADCDRTKIANCKNQNYKCVLMNWGSNALVNNCVAPNTVYADPALCAKSGRQWVYFKTSSGEHYPGSPAVCLATGEETFYNGSRWISRPRPKTPQ